MVVGLAGDGLMVRVASGRPDVARAELADGLAERVTFARSLPPTG